MTGYFVLSGFKQTDRKEVGMSLTQRWLEETFDPRPDHKVFDTRAWKADMKGLAALAQRRGVTEAVVLAYSHGGGYAAPHLVHHLHRRGIYTKLVLLCDPVYRPLWLPRWTIAQILAFRALIPHSAVIRFPAHVGEIHGIRQEENIPRAHSIQIGGGEPFQMQLVRGYKHHEIDESPEWFELVKSYLHETPQDH